MFDSEFRVFNLSSPAGEAFKSGISQIVAELSKLSLGDLRPRNLHKVGGKIWDLIQSMLEGIDLSGMTKEQFIDAVDNLYDTIVAPQVIAFGPLIGPMLNSVLNSVVLSAAGRFYDNHS